MPKLTYAVLIAGLCASSAHAAETTVNRPKVYSDIVACRALADAAAPRERGREIGQMAAANP